MNCNFGRLYMERIFYATIVPHLLAEANGLQTKKKIAQKGRVRNDSLSHHCGSVCQSLGLNSW